MLLNAGVNRGLRDTAGNRKIAWANAVVVRRGKKADVVAMLFFAQSPLAPAKKPNFLKMWVSDRFPRERIEERDI